jgi:syntenin-1
MSLYPSLEDMKVDQMAKAQHQYAASQPAPAIAPSGPPAYGQAPSPSASSPSLSSLYPSLSDYMGLDVSTEAMERHMAVAAHNPPQQMQLARQTPSSQMQVAPVTGNNIGVLRAEVKQGIRFVVVCKDQEGKIGLRVREVNKGIFVAFVYRDSAAALAGLRFGDQILQINEETVAGWSTDKCMKYLKNAAPDRITMAVRDRPFERTITLQKDSSGHVGFVFKENKITALVKDSSAARNGVLIDHHLLEVNGQNVVGLKEKEIKELIDNIGRTVTITIIPSYIYEHIVKSMGSSLVKKYMDHSVPDV